MRKQLDIMAKEKDDIAECLSQEGGFSGVFRVKDVSGGILNNARLYDTDAGKVFVKYSDRENAFRMYTSEKASQQLINNMDIIRTPKPGQVYNCAKGGAVFHMEWIDDLMPMTDRWAELGSKMARLHKFNADLIEKSDGESQRINAGTKMEPVTQFGFNYAHFVGASFEVDPGWHDNWPEYFTRSFLQPNLEMLAGKGYKDVAEMWSELSMHIDKAFDGIDIKPCLTHGDFCTINVGQTATEAVLYDPGCTYSHYETDHIIPTFEDNFPQEFYDAYHKVLPKEKGYDARMKLYSCYAFSMMANAPYEEEESCKNCLKYGQDFLKLIKQL